MNIFIKDDENFYKNIRKYKDKNVSLESDTTDLVKKQMIIASNEKDLEKRYSYIYDVVCTYLDNEFKNKNICCFENNRCISVRNNGHCRESLNGCCYGTKRGLCKNFKDGRCTIKAISCKLFTCRYLKKQGVKYRVNDIFLLKYFFNIRQKFLLENSIFKDKDEIIKLLLENK